VGRGEQEKKTHTHTGQGRAGQGRVGGDLHLIKQKMKIDKIRIERIKT
jgi:hypothetical protein